MSAARAAAALLAHDTALAVFAASLPCGYAGQKREIVIDHVRENVLNSWTLTLAAHAAGVTEEQVVAALFYAEPLRFGSTLVCRGEARRLFSAD